MFFKSTGGCIVGRKLYIALGVPVSIFERTMCGGLYIITCTVILFSVVVANYKG